VATSLYRYAQALLGKQGRRRHFAALNVNRGLVLGWLVAINQVARLGAQVWGAGTLKGKRWKQVLGSFESLQGIGVVALVSRGRWSALLQHDRQGTRDSRFYTNLSRGFSHTISRPWQTLPHRELTTSETRHTCWPYRRLQLLRFLDRHAAGSSRTWNQRFLLKNGTRFVERHVALAGACWYLDGHVQSPPNPNCTLRAKDRAGKEKPVIVLRHLRVPSMTV
jgi:hypothetical protein